MDDNYDVFMQKLHKLIENYSDHVEYVYDSNDSESAVITLDTKRYMTLRDKIRNMSRESNDMISKYVKRTSMENGVLQAVVHTDNLYYKKPELQAPPMPTKKPVPVTADDCEEMGAKAF